MESVVKYYNGLDEVDRHKKNYFDFENKTIADSQLFNCFNTCNVYR